MVVNLYPFRETVASGASPDEVIEKIDIGGPAMVRAAAKNFESVGVVVDPARYAVIVAELREHGGLLRETRRALAAAAFAHTAAYDAAVADWFAAHTAEGDALPSYVGLAYERIGELRYGENPHQRAALYREAATAGPLYGAKVLQGKEMSFNNWLDAYAAHELAGAMPPASAVIVKHNNPCGAATKGSLAESYRAAFACDEVSAFGGIVAFHGEVDVDAAQAMADVFTEVVIAPSYTAAASAAFSDRPNLRIVSAPMLGGAGLDVASPAGRCAHPRPRHARGDACRLEGGLQSRTLDPRMGRPRARVDHRLAREVQHDRVGERTERRWASAPGRCRAWTPRGSRRARRVSARGGRWSLPTRSSRSPTPSRSRPMRAAPR